MKDVEVPFIATWLFMIVLLIQGVWTCNNTESLNKIADDKIKAEVDKAVKATEEKLENQYTRVAASLVTIRRYSIKTGKLDKVFTGCSEVNVYRDPTDGSINCVEFKNDKIKRGRNGGDQYAEDDDYLWVSIMNEDRWMARANYAATRWDPIFKYTIEVEKK